MKKHLPRILCVIPTVPGDPFLDAFESVLAQTVKVDYVFFTFKKGSRTANMGAKMSGVMNDLLGKVKIEQFDYLLRVDADMILPPNFLQENLKDKPDYCGQSASAQIIKVSSFIKVFNGRFPWFNDDSYVLRKFIIEGYKFRKWTVRPICRRVGGSPHGAGYFVTRGLLQYQIGYTPLHSLASAVVTLKENKWGPLVILGYLWGLITRLRLDVASWTWTEQVKSIGRRFL